MSKIKDFFKYIYKEFYNSDMAYLITTSVYLVFCVAFVSAYLSINPIPFEQAIFSVPFALCGVLIVFIPVYLVIVAIYAAIDSLIFEIKFKVEGLKISKKKSNKFKKNR